MARRLLGVGCATAIALALSAATAMASPDQGTPVVSTPLAFLVDPFQEELQIEALSANSTGSGTKHIGPVPSSSGDSGTCGPDWANETFDRYFTIRQTGPATYTVYEQFKNGVFVTIEGFSPGACDPGDGYGPGTVSEGRVGTMHGYLIANVVCADPLIPCLDPTAACGGPADPCQTTSDFLAAFFPGAGTLIDTYFFHYAGYDGTNQALIVHEWKNASCNRGGNHGDIADATVAAPFLFDTCP
jgi:hypothetical protein